MCWHQQVSVHISELYWIAQNTTLTAEREKEQCVCATGDLCVQGLRGGVQWSVVWWCYVRGYCVLSLCLSYASSLISYPDLLPPLRPFLCATPTTLFYLPLLALPTPAFLPTLCTPPHPYREGIYRCPGDPPVLRARFVRPSGGQLDWTVQRQVCVRACVRLFF